MSKKSVKTMSEKELRKSDAPWPQTEKELLSYIHALVERKHTYGTCVYAMSLAAVATFHYVAHKLGATGFQAGCADLDILVRTRHLKHGFKIVNYEYLLYPQYLTDEHFPTWSMLIQENKAYLKEEAKKLLKTQKGAADKVKEHWKYLAAL